ncbi:uncharacterized protein EI90DRAFT_3059271 [Cantharellus anzutake]|uniref:uncharacterized protein n=1 Tax=Cantharellus anzutake TaxID=1750568 RepID=UPI001906987D|nr:uncharacterized protein EI90DRAFT_3059271 [Cantharellus anzutake]KAF8330789.1 hypothetical protein EI90DRAFT_3059271 [Cantharellus anzutake]
MAFHAGSVHDVAPGRMRNFLAPRKLARYVLRGEEPVFAEQPAVSRSVCFDRVA